MWGGTHLWLCPKHGITRLKGINIFFWVFICINTYYVLKLRTSLYQDQHVGTYSFLLGRFGRALHQVVMLISPALCCEYFSQFSFCLLALLQAFFFYPQTFLSCFVIQHVRLFLCGSVSVWCLESPSSVEDDKNSHLDPCPLHFLKKNFILYI